MQTKSKEQLELTEHKAVKNLFQHPEDAWDEMDLAGSSEGPLRRTKAPYIEETAEQLNSDVKEVLNPFHTTEKLLRYLERLKGDIAASQAANSAIPEVIQELNNTFKETCIKSAYVEAF